ncbi:MAG: hypothetical protein AAFR04_02420 [Pseudomonadota bacterium]
MSAFVPASPGLSLEKTMSLSLREFEISLRRLDAAPETVGADTYRLAHGDGTVDISARALEPAVLGKLMRLPRCLITIRFSDTHDEAARRAFLVRFDLAFQRGGG